MTLIVAGTVRVPPENIDGLRPHMVAMMAASRAEDGCFDYSYAEDVAEPGLIHVFERWRDQAALDAHFKHRRTWPAWRAAWPELRGFRPPPHRLRGRRRARALTLEGAMPKLLLLPGDGIGPEVTAEVAPRRRAAHQRPDHRRAAVRRRQPRCARRAADRRDAGDRQGLRRGADGRGGRRGRAHRPGRRSRATCAPKPACWRCARAWTCSPTCARRICFGAARRRLDA